MTADLFDLEQSRQEAPETPPRPVPLAEGAVLFPGLALPDVPALLAGVEAVSAECPFEQLETPGGGRMSVEMTACGAFGWRSDRKGYRYAPLFPATGRPWPPLPPAFAALSRRAAAAAGFDRAPLQSCLINRYNHRARMSLHQDRDEGELITPIVSVSLGVAATFLWGGLNRSDPTRRIRLAHGDVVVWGGPSRLTFHGVTPLPSGEHPATGPCRINITFRQVTADMDNFSTP